MRVYTAAHILSQYGVKDCLVVLVGQPGMVPEVTIPVFPVSGPTALVHTALSLRDRVHVHMSITADHTDVNAAPP